MSAGATQALAVGLTQVAVQMEHLERVVGALEYAVSKLARGEVVEDIPEIKTSFDSLWTCKFCGRRLGVYDREQDVLRVKHKDFYLQFRSGPGGYVSVVCVSCGCENTAVYEQPA